MMTPAELALARGTVLAVLQDYLNRPREIAPGSEPTYMVQDLLHEMLARRGYPMSEHELRGSVLFYLEQAGLIEYRSYSPGGPKSPTFLSWRLTHDGQQVLG